MLQHLYTIAPQPFARDPHHCLKHRHSTHASLLPGPDHQRSTVRRVPPAWLQALIVGNFIFSIAEKEYDPYRDEVRAISLRRSSAPPPPRPLPRTPAPPAVHTRVHPPALARADQHPPRLSLGQSPTLQSRTTPAKPTKFPPSKRSRPAICTPPPTHPLSTPRRRSTRRTLESGPPAPPFST